MVEIKMTKDAIDFHDLVRQLEKAHDFDFHDMAGIYRKQLELCKEYGINHTKWYNKQFTKMNETELKIKEICDELEYENVWHWLTDNDFEDLADGNQFQMLDLSVERLAEDMPEFVRKFFIILRAELNVAGITDDAVEFYID